MSNEDHQDEPSLAAIIKANVRGWNSYWSWKDKLVGECGAARDTLAAGVSEVLCKSASVRGLRGQRTDPMGSVR